MNAEDRAAQALAKHYDIDGGTDMVRLRCPRLHEIITKEIREAELRGYDRAKGEAYENGYKEGYNTRSAQVEDAHIAARGEVTFNVPPAKLRQAMDDAHAEEKAPVTGGYFGIDPAAGDDFTVVVIAIDPLPVHMSVPAELLDSNAFYRKSLDAAAARVMPQLAADLDAMITGARQTFECVTGISQPPPPTLQSLTQTPPEPADDVPLFVYFEGVDPESDGAADLRFHPVDDVAMFLAGEFCVPRPCGVGFCNGTGHNLQVRMAEPGKNPHTVAYVREAVRRLVHEVVAERDAAWSVALADAGFEVKPLTPEGVAAAVELHEDAIEAARDGEWANAFHQSIDNAAPREGCIVPLNPEAVAQAMTDDRRRVRRGMLAHTEQKCDEAAKTARAREHAACAKAAKNAAAGHIDAANRFTPGRMRSLHVDKAHGALDAAQAILDRDTQDVPADREADARPIPRSH